MIIVPIVMLLLLLLWLRGLRIRMRGRPGRCTIMRFLRMMGIIIVQCLVVLRRIMSSTANAVQLPTLDILWNFLLFSVIHFNLVDPAVHVQRGEMSDEIRYCR